MIELIALDMDGTLLMEDKTLHQIEIDAVQKAIKKGVKVVLCTGRAVPGVKPFVKQLQMSGDNDYAITNNGCSTHITKDWSLVSWHQLTKQDMLQLYDIAKHEDVQLTLFDEDHYFVVEEEPSDIVIYDASVVNLYPTKISIEEAISGKYTMFQAMFLAPKDILDKFQQKYEASLQQQYSVVRSQTYIFEILPYDVTKASALKRLAKQLNILPEHIMAVGDANNDIEMLQFAGVSVAMGNASDNIKQIAAHVTDSNNNHGVAKAIERYVLDI